MCVRFFKLNWLSIFAVLSSCCYFNVVVCRVPADYKSESAQHILCWVWPPSSSADDLIQAEGFKNWEDSRCPGWSFKNPWWTGKQIFTHFIGWTSGTLDRFNDSNELFEFCNQSTLFVICLTALKMWTDYLWTYVLIWLFKIIQLCFYLEIGTPWHPHQAHYCPPRPPCVSARGRLWIFQNLHSESP